MSKQTITVIPGDGIGPSIIDSTIQILDKAGCDFIYEYADAGLGAYIHPHATTATTCHTFVIPTGA